MLPEGAIKCNSVKAFTTIELIVVMMIISSAIGIIFSSYNAIQKAYTRHWNSSKMITEYISLKSVLDVDFRTALTVRDSLGILIIEKSDNSQQVIYMVDAYRIIRTRNSLTDTFNIPSSQILYQKNPNDTSLIEAFSMELIVSGQSLPLFAKKLYSAEEIMKNKDFNYEWTH